MSTLHRIIVVLIALISLLCLVMIPDWFEDPRKLAPGEWKDAGKQGMVEVTDATLTLHGFGPEGPIPYTWLQTDKEPYTMQVCYGSHTVEAAITFNGENEVVADLDIMHKLPSDIADTLRRRNTGAGRPENEFRLVFRRIIPKN